MSSYAILDPCCHIRIIQRYILVGEIAKQRGDIVTMVVWQQDLQLPMQSVPITTDVVSSSLDQGEVYDIM